MHRRLTRTVRLTVCFALGCGSVELVGVDKATVLTADAGPGAPDASVLDASMFDANLFHASLDATPDALVDAGALCPATVPSEGTVCSAGLACIYPYWCCKQGPVGTQRAQCDGRWRFDEAECAGCLATTP